jgi:hypothetical protein
MSYSNAVWDSIKADYIRGIPLDELARKYGVRYKTILLKAKAKEWGGEFRSAHKNNQDKAELKGNEIVTRHCNEANLVRERLYVGINRHRSALDLISKKLAYEDLRAAKLAVECLLLLHKIERQAYGIGKGDIDQIITIERSYE